MPEPVLRKVRFITEEHLDSVPLRIRTEAPTLAPGINIQFEVGARWTFDQGTRKHVEGHWVDCVVVAETPRDLLVQLIRP